MNRVYRLSTRFGQQPASCLCSAMIRAHRLSTRFGQQPASCLCSAMNRVYRLSTRFGAKPAERTQHAGLRAGRLRPAGLFEAEQTAALLSGVSCGPPTSSGPMPHHISAAEPHNRRMPVKSRLRSLDPSQGPKRPQPAARHDATPYLVENKRPHPEKGGAVLLSDRKNPVSVP